MGILLKIFQLLGAKYTKDIVVFTLLKLFLASLMLVAFPVALSTALVILYNGINTRVLAFVSDRVTDASLSSVIIEASGLLAFFVNHLNLVESFDLIVSAIALRVLLNLVPFSRV